jgi:hypothetical protein
MRDLFFTVSGQLKIELHIRSWISGIDSCYNSCSCCYDRHNGYAAKSEIICAEESKITDNTKLATLLLCKAMFIAITARLGAKVATAMSRLCSIFPHNMPLLHSLGEPIDSVYDKVSHQLPVIIYLLYKSEKLAETVLCGKGIFSYIDSVPMVPLISTILFISLTIILHEIMCYSACPISLLKLLFH